jgi:hypothetical protein
MTALDSKTAVQERLLGRHAQQARSLIVSKLSDARAHAALTVTPTMKGRADGRQTLSAIRRHPSYQAAVARIGELKEETVKLIEQARVEMLETSVSQWARMLPESLIGPGPHSPTAELTSKVRTLVLYGHTVQFFLSDPFGRSVHRLLPAAERAGSEVATVKDSRDALSTWARQETDALSTAVTQLLATSLTAIDVIAGRSLIPADQLEPIADGVYGWS